MIYFYTRKELKKLKAVDFKENDTVHVVDNLGETIYDIIIGFGEFKRPIRTIVYNSKFESLNCTPGTRGGWPYYIAEFIHGI